MSLPNKRRWLLIIIWLVVILNLFYFTFMRFKYKDRLIQKYVINYLEKITQGEVSIRDLTFSDRFVMIEGIRVYLPAINMEFRAESIHVEYNLMRLIWNRIKDQPYTENIYVNKPFIRVNLEPLNWKKNHGNYAVPPIPELRKFLRNLHLYEGEIVFSLDVEEFRIFEKFHQIDAHMQTENGVSAHITGETDNQGILDVDLDLSGGWFNSLTAIIKDYQPLDMYITEIDTLGAVYDIKFSYLPDLMSLEAGLKDVYIEVADRKISVDSLDLSGDGRELQFFLENPIVDGNRVAVAGTLLNTFSAAIGVDAEFTGENISLASFQQIISGDVNIQGRMTGAFTDFTINAAAQGDSLKIGGQVLQKAAVSAVISNSNLEFKINKLEWENNYFDGEGFFGYDNTISARAGNDSLSYTFANINISGELSAEYNNNKSEPSHLQLSNVSIKSPYMNMDKLELDAYYSHPNISISLHRIHNDLSLTGEFDLAAGNFNTELQLRRFQLGSLIDIFTFPSCTGAITCQGNRDSILAESNLRFYDQHYGNFDGRIKASALLDFHNQKSFLDLHTSNARYNYQDLKVDLRAEGNLESISTREFKLNEVADIQATFFLKPKPDIMFNISAQKLDLQQIIKYLVDYRTLADFNGYIDLDLEADTRKEGKFKGSIKGRDIRIGEMNNLSTELSLQGNEKRIDLSESRICLNNTDLGFIMGNLTITPEFNLAMKSSIPLLDLEELLPDNNIKGICIANLRYSYEDKSVNLDLELKGKNFNFNGVKLDAVDIDISQKDSLLIIRRLSLAEGKGNSLQAKGSIGYNLLNSRTFYDNNEMNIEFSGDLLKILQQNISYIKEGSSNCTIQLKLSMGENGPDIEKAHFVLKGSKLQLKDQPKPFTAINIDIMIKDNILNIQDFVLKIGNGKLLLENSVGYNEQDLYLHSINIGQILIYTSKSGIDFYLPQYSKSKSVSHLLIKGRNSRYLKFFNNQGNALLLGDLIINNTDVIYPPQTDNLMRIMNNFSSSISQSWSVKKKKEIKIRKDLAEATEQSGNPAVPFDLDIYLETGENVRYVTYPFEITFAPGSYVYLKFMDGKFSIPDANFSSEDGRMVLVGTRMEVENILITYNQQLEKVDLEAVFSRKTADGTKIELVITNEREGSFPNNLEMVITSDNADDRTDTEKLFRLRYGRGLDDISSTERQTLFHDDLIQTAGGEIENIIIDPMINQFEVYIGRILNIDYFQMETSFIYNLLSSNSDLYGNSEDQDKKYSSDILLENLSLKAGKYMLDDLFLNYKITFQKVYKTELDTKMGVYHTISFRYDMPLNIKFIYEYNIDPYEEDSHEYSFSRTVRFNDLTDLYYRIFYPYSWQKKGNKRLIMPLIKE